MALHNGRHWEEEKARHAGSYKHHRKITCGSEKRTAFSQAALKNAHNNNGRNGSCLTWLATSLEEKRIWLIINASPRGQCSK